MTPEEMVQGKAPTSGFWAYESVLAVVKEAVAQEQERCAKVAENWELKHYGRSGGGYEGEEIAEEIRGTQ